ncbi:MULTISPECIES: peptidase domain-containing ABC transporter [unclassified Paludibacterium]|uniref:peptidase domain-containing ABC transporter n=1 Tax=unclassified Paludibacterium TaxID=2618429 RepID=UPI001C053DB4|nr:peptidase domain-containing ABC transporter [Paludibacterium sp. B53371]BEV71955.1 peptidase domain-containing ABC transporter [Paludibacterium sp. THUN1379]
MVSLPRDLLRQARLPLYLQSEAAECGLACLGMIAAYHGHRADLPSWRQRFTTSLKGATLADLIRMADQIGLAARALRLEPAEMAQLPLPCILHWEMNHFVVLAGVDRHGVWLHDPAQGRRRLNWQEVDRSFSGVALSLTPTETFRPLVQAQRFPWRQWLSGFDGLAHAVLQVFVLALLLELLGLLAPQFTQWLIDGVLLSADQEMLHVLVSGFLLVLLGEVGIAALRAWSVLHISHTLGLHWHLRVFHHLLRLPLSYFEKRFIGDISARFGSIAAIQKTLTSQCIEAVLDGLLALGTGTLMLLYSPPLALISLASLGGYALLRFLGQRPLRERHEREIVRQARQEGHFLESLRGMQAIKLFQRQAERQSVWSNLLVEQIHAAMQTDRADILYRSLQRLLSGLEYAALLWFGAGLVLTQQFSVGMFMAFAAYAAQFSQRTKGLIDKGAALAMLRLQGERLADIILCTPEAETLPGSSLPASTSIELRDVWFRHDEQSPWILQGVNLRIADGESVALTGPSGCGKSTLLKLLLGMLTPTRGEMLIGGVPWTQIGTHGVRTLCGTVMQDDQLFAGSLLDNITFFDPSPDIARAEHCARLAAIHDTLAAMPMGYHTLCGDMGSVLSGGQKQRLLLARALYKQPRILLLDEATSSLDTPLEQQVNQAVATLKLTRLIVAHRPETIASADRHVMLGVDMPADTTDAQIPPVS